MTPAWVLIVWIAAYNSAAFADRIEFPDKASCLIAARDIASKLGGAGASRGAVCVYRPGTEK